MCSGDADSPRQDDFLTTTTLPPTIHADIWGKHHISRNHAVGVGYSGYLVGTARFELATPCTPSKCATRLRHVPTRGNQLNGRTSGRQCKGAHAHPDP